MSEPVTAPSSPAPSRTHHGVPEVGGHGHGADKRLIKLAFGALGVVYGDIGTSPLYSLRECFAGGMETTHENILGVLSLISWSLIIMITFKYIAYVLRADNKGEGGILALMALSSSNLRKSRAYLPLIFLGVFGSALLYGDG
ncbi:MAG: KUP/HAK/KT family potassium transporter, partial [Polyangiaceae bacterium]